MMHNIPQLLALLMALAGCASQPLPPSATLPSGAVSGGGDPMRSAILSSAYVFGSPGAATPQGTARAAMMVEYMAADYRWNPRWGEFTPIVGGAVGCQPRRTSAGLGRRAGRVAAGGGQRALRRFPLHRGGRCGRGAGCAAPEAFSAPDTTLRQLAALPPLPITRSATSLAERELHRIDSQSHFNSGGVGGAHP
jgi:hypothetical protein